MQAKIARHLMLFAQIVVQMHTHCSDSDWWLGVCFCDSDWWCVGHLFLCEIHGNSGANAEIQIGGALPFCFLENVVQMHTRCSDSEWWCVALLFFGNSGANAYTLQWFGMVVRWPFVDKLAFVSVMTRHRSNRKVLHKFKRQECGKSKRIFLNSPLVRINTHCF